MPPPLRVEPLRSSTSSSSSIHVSLGPSTSNSNSSNGLNAPQLSNRWRGTLACGHLLAGIDLQPSPTSLVNETSATGPAFPASLLSIAGFVREREVPSPAVLSRHLVLPVVEPPPVGMAAAVAAAAAAATAATTPTVAQTLAAGSASTSTLVASSANGSNGSQPQQAPTQSVFARLFHGLTGAYLLNTSKETPIGGSGVGYVAVVLLAQKPVPWYGLLSVHFPLHRTKPNADIPWLGKVDNLIPFHSLTPVQQQRYISLASSASVARRAGLGEEFRETHLYIPPASEVEPPSYASFSTSSSTFTNPVSYLSSTSDSIRVEYSKIATFIRSIGRKQCDFLPELQNWHNLAVALACPSLVEVVITLLANRKKQIIEQEDGGTDPNAMKLIATAVESCQAILARIPETSSLAPLPLAVGNDANESLSRKALPRSKRTMEDDEEDYDERTERDKLRIKRIRVQSSAPSSSMSTPALAVPPHSVLFPVSSLGVPVASDIPVASDMTGLPPAPQPQQQQQPDSQVPPPQLPPQPLLQQMPPPQLIQQLPLQPLQLPSQLPPAQFQTEGGYFVASVLPMNLGVPAASAPPMMPMGPMAYGPIPMGHPGMMYPMMQYGMPAYGIPPMAHPQTMVPYEQMQTINPQMQPPMQQQQLQPMDPMQAMYNPGPSPHSSS
ncbi:hypothetical protein CAOG_002693 [Capsaspora owczarzaki ATCC 30864]|uniref:Integrator complex subunit 14 beta-barrel domain-containing protein n=1 Tax=Capsaspora owczarzaki (strain ATCC 30864) TaxID=595528 RepID=A0A0D2WMV2_CAPO3|nr:hypothetical protein CAOG_002693 [Capsaspora owczarzaki ATCC 30864]